MKRQNKTAAAPFDALNHEVTIPIESDVDVVTARLEGKDFARDLEFTQTELTFVATAISEIGRNIVEYAKSGTISLKIIQQGDRRGIMVIAEDEGPGIPDIEAAM